jgi:hypothetical protein
VAASRHDATPQQGEPVTSGSVTPYTTSVDANAGQGSLLSLRLRPTECADATGGNRQEKCPQSPEAALRTVGPGGALVDVGVAVVRARVRPDRLV